MKVNVSSLVDFLAELKKADRLYQNCVRCDIDETPLQPERVTVKVAVVASAIVVVANDPPGAESEYLLECVLDCGVDNHSQRDMSASAAAREYRDRLAEHVKPIGLTVRPGRVEL